MICRGHSDIISSNFFLSFLSHYSLRLPIPSLLPPGGPEGLGAGGWEGDHSCLSLSSARLQAGFRLFLWPVLLSFPLHHLAVGQGTLSPFDSCVSNILGAARALLLYNPKTTEHKDATISLTFLREKDERK